MPLLEENPMVKAALAADALQLDLTTLPKLAL